jgi:hypothetical protein
VLTDIMLYGAATTLLIGLAGLAVERIAGQLSCPRRGVWLATLILSLAFPAVMILTAQPTIVARGTTPRRSSASPPQGKCRRCQTRNPEIHPIHLRFRR